MCIKMIMQQKTNILIVNDRPDQLLTWETILLPLNQNIIKADSGQQALRLLLTNQDFSVILLDVKMPDMNGFETAKLIRQRKKNDSTPIVFMTAAEFSPMDEFAGYSLGAVDYLISPVEPGILQAKIRAFVDLYLKTLQVRESEQNFRQLAETIQEVFWIITPDLSKVIYISPLYEKIWGRSIDNLYLTPKEWLDAVFPEDLNIVMETFAKFAQGEKAFKEYRIVRPDNTIRWIYARGYPLYDENGVLYRVAGIAEDITEKKHLEDLAFRHKHHLELAELKRINSMGEMASTMAHELNQPLTSITTYTQGCIRKLQADGYPDSEVINSLKLVAYQAKRAGEIIHHMKNFIRKGELLMEVLSVNEIITNLIPLLNYERKSTVTKIIFELDEHLPLAYFDKIQIEQVLINLTRNAIEALHDSKIAEPTIIIKTELKDEQIIVSIIDNGPGLGENDASQLFNPYVSTKGMKNRSNMGMGLAISRTVIEAHGGQLSASSHPPSGACFQFTLPTHTYLQPLIPAELTYE